MLSSLERVGARKAEISAALDEAEQACAEKSEAWEDSEHANAVMVALLKEAKQKYAAMFGGGDKISDKESHSETIGMVIVNALAIIMKHMQPITLVCT